MVHFKYIGNKSKRFKINWGRRRRDRMVVGCNQCISLLTL